MVEYCEKFKMEFSKIQDLLRGLKIRSKAPTSYNSNAANKELGP